MFSEKHQPVVLDLDTGGATAFFVHPELLLTCGHVFESATRAAVFLRSGKHIGRVISITDYRSVGIDLALVAIHQTQNTSHVPLTFSKNNLSSGKRLHILGHRVTATTEKIFPVRAKVHAITDNEVHYIFRENEVPNHTHLMGVSEGPVFEEGSYEVSAIHSGCFVSVENSPTMGFAVPSHIAYDLLTTFVGSNFKREK